MVWREKEKTKQRKKPREKERKWKKKRKREKERRFFPKQQFDFMITRLCSFVVAFKLERKEDILLLTTEVMVS